MAERRRRHHTVPRFYLEGFAREGQIGTVELPGDRRFVQATRDATAITDFYTVRDEDGNPDDALEKVLSEVEGQVHPLLRRVITDNEWPLKGEERDTLAWWFALQYTRGPDFRAGMEQIAAVVTKLELGIEGPESLQQRARERLGRDLDDAELAEMWEQAMGPDGPPITFTPLGHMREAYRQLPEIVPYFAGRHWQLVRFTRKALLTGDCPVTLVSRPDGSDYAPGLAQAAAICVPLSRRVALLMLGPSDEMLKAGPPPRGSLDDTIAPSAGLARAVNWSTIHGARRWVFHHPEDASVVDAFVLPPPRLKQFDTSDTDFVRDLHSKMADD